MTALCDDGSCEYTTCAGCTNPSACNYDPDATIFDDSCEFDSCQGCTNPNACNYDPEATINDGSCDLSSCLGCTDPTACNYDDTFTIDDGSCEYLTLEITAVNPLETCLSAENPEGGLTFVDINTPDADETQSFIAFVNQVGIIGWEEWGLSEGWGSTR